MTRCRKGRTGPQHSMPVEDIAAMLGERWRDIRWRLGKVSLESASGRGTPDVDDRINALVGESFAVERRLVRTPAASSAGIAAKVRIATMLLRDLSSRDTIEGRLLASALRDLERRPAEDQAQDQRFQRSGVFRAAPSHRSVRGESS